MLSGVFTRAKLYNMALNKYECQFTPKVCICCILYGWFLDPINLPDCTRTAILVNVVFKVSESIRKISKVLHGVEITVIKEEWTVTGIYRSPNVPERHLCDAMTEVLNNILPNITTISLFLGLKYKLAC